MEEQERVFTGVWFPRELWLNPELTMLEKAIYIEIESLDNDKTHCIASNKYFADFCQCSERKVSEAITKLQDMKMLEITAFDGRHRTIRIAKNTRQTRKKCEADSQKVQAININNIKENISTNVDIKESEREDKKKFAPPTLDEVKTYVVEKQYSMSAEDFYYHYESVNWYRGKTRITNWKNAVTQWEKHNNKMARPFDGLQFAHDDNFKKTIGFYPKEVTELDKARITWANAIRKYGDTLETVKDIGNAIFVYKRECEENGTEERYIKSFDNFMKDSLEYYIKKVRDMKCKN